MERLAHKLLPLLLGLVAALVLVTGIRGFRAERPALPAVFGRLTTPFVTEAPAPAVEIVLADGRQVQLEPGSVARQLWDYLAAGTLAPRSFTFADAAIDTDVAPDAGATPDAAAAPEAWLRIAAILARHPAARIALAGDPAPELQRFLQAQGVAGDRLRAADDASAEGAPAGAAGTGAGPAADAGAQATAARPLQLIVNPQP